MPARRLEDHAVRMWIATPGKEGALDLAEYEYTPGSGQPPRPAAGAGAGARRDMVVLIPLSESEGVLVAGAELVRLSAAENGGLVEKAAREAVEWRRRATRARRNARADERLVALAERLDRESTADAIVATLRDEAATIVGAHATAVLVRQIQPLEEGAVLRPAALPRCVTTLPPVPIEPFLPLSTPGVLRPDGIVAGSPLAALAPLFGSCEAAAAFYAGIGERGLLIVLERRSDRELEPEDWLRLTTLARYAASSLERAQLREQTQALSLVDPLTGLGNRRRLEVVLPQHLAAAERGVPLAVAVFRVDDDGAAGRSPGDREADLHAFGECLLGQARASDLVVRNDASTFLALLPATGLSGARALAARVLDAAPAGLQVRAGTAAFGGEIRTFATLLERALVDATPPQHAGRTEPGL